ncbi:adenylyl-sulfate kinase [Paraliomyxa miuraensis]|uniref:adenylyl-sulfate kinase n=1 Tax=Paraliomyxa miuraensis TaxID=376150 RepID=UPI002252FFAF|nr:adenylyl-sulfate kinase [Paraliomyxa miuraensis]MCX4240802.1 adenylyl-sulfate kinase [Paraliomyxa miuraensis]
MPELSVGDLGTARLEPEDRERLHGHGGALLWFTGLSGAGKSTIANLVDHALHQRGRHSVLLDGDVVRTGLCGDLGFSPHDRAENVRRIGEVGRLFAQTGVIAIVAVIAPYAQDRDAARARMREDRFIEIFVDAPLQVCEERDPKGLYAKARAGVIKDFTGIDAPYETPTRPELHLDSSGGVGAQALAEQVLAYLRQHGFA